MRTISIEKPTGTFFKTYEPQNRTVCIIFFVEHISTENLKFKKIRSNYIFIHRNLLARKSKNNYFQ